MKCILQSYKKDIFFDFITHNKPADTIILLPGFPGYFKLDNLMSFLHEKGYNVFFPKYKGFYQSKGEFLKTNIVDDMGEFIRLICKGKTTSLWDMNKVKYGVKRLIIISECFGSLVALGLSAKYPFFNKIVLISPFWEAGDLENIEKGEGTDQLHWTKYVKRAYNNVCRYDFNNFAKELNKIEEFKKSFYLPRIKNVQVLTFHDAKDKIVPFKFSRKMDSQPNILIKSHQKGHFIIDSIIPNWKIISSFLNNKSVTKKAQK